MSITKSDYYAILRAGITPKLHTGDSGGLSGFAEACYSDNSPAELLAAYAQYKADSTDCENWKIRPGEWRESIREALEQRAFDFEDFHNFECAE